MESTALDPNLSQRRHMVAEQIRARGITDDRVLQAIEQIPREKFIPPTESVSAFADRALPIGCGQTISQPFMVASMTVNLTVRKDHKVLEIGTGSGYQTAILARLAHEVYTIERMQPLHKSAQSLLKSMGIDNVVYRVGDGSVGWPEHAFFDRIMVTAGAPKVPKALIDQLANGGRLVIPVGGESEQILTVVERINGKTRELPQYPCRFVKLVGRQAWPGTQASETNSH